MTNEPKSKSRLLEAVHETARDLHRLGFIDKRKNAQVRRAVPGAGA